MKQSRMNGLVACLLSVAVAGSAMAGFDVDLGASFSIGDDDNDLYVAVSARYFDEDRHAVQAVATHYPNRDDLAVALFIGRHSGRSTEAIYDLRRSGLSWFEISARFGVPYDVWFVPVKHDPGPPYGKAYGHHKKHGQASQPAALTDADIRNLVAVRMLHEYYGVSVEVAMDWRSGGRGLDRLVSDEYHKRHGKPDKAGKPQKSNPSSGKGNGKKK